MALLGGHDRGSKTHSLRFHFLRPKPPSPRSHLHVLWAKPILRSNVFFFSCSCLNSLQIHDRRRHICSLVDKSAAAAFWPWVVVVGVATANSTLPPVATGPVVSNLCSVFIWPLFGSWDKEMKENRKLWIFWFLYILRKENSPKVCGGFC